MKGRIALVIAAMLMILIGSAAIASNMGFKISIPLYATGTGHTGLNWVSLPYYVNYANASEAWTDLNSISGLTYVDIDQYQEADGTYLMYDGDIYTDNFVITSGGQLTSANALLVKVDASVNWVVVGSHSPSLTVPLYATGTGHTGLNWRSVPYHTTAANASALWTELNAVTPNTAYVDIDQYQEADGTYLMYDNDIYTDNFVVSAGKPVLIKVDANKTWTPAHY